ncbi:hypothetical protein BKG82_03115 [Mycobacteroides chelonae]|uniref:Uncharacterized protein n=1 Tax=Mycobacteroides chelonae TaxID=1774 RepID=A0A1S1LP81_MYCCH|nr:hypothetical protein AOT87_14445 [Mycobacteroides sp. H003]KRQ27671.1 hypothetical protein AOT91_19325 [Mycobacteroides sp. H092]KRQ40768.1 hypothetical protein AOT92_14065 [Mycobacteroides sp. H101]KRQ42464.1 hypothetical protein AOT88_27505 [Mycobacteroides sp. H063]KRQ54700.1 hypothetical protein AOT94_24770 [Mycobacteroides sp. HXVII]KRQ71993.1 hypothetical protein AOT93_28175 [Mycobacteroides sp. H110]KRQ80492.1 hypothetical protein AOT95_13705 [Mycobacteroides sp. HXXIII]OHU27033.1 
MIGATPQQSSFDRNCCNRRYGGRPAAPMTQPTTTVTELLAAATEAMALSERYQCHYDGAQGHRLPVP